MKCPQCATENPAQARFCMNCAHPFAATQPGRTATQPERTLPADDAETTDGDIFERIIQSRQVEITRDSTGNTIITGDNNRVIYSPDEAPAFLLRLYYRSLAEECRRLPLGLVNEEFTRPGTTRQVTLTSVYTDLDVVSAPSGEGEGKSARWMGMRLEQGSGGERVPLLEALGLPEARLTALVGAPGSGKSTFINYLASRLAAGQTAGLPEGVQSELVVRLELRQAATFIRPDAPCGTAEMLWQALKADVSRTWGEDTAGDVLPYLQRQLILKGGWVLLDGLDEVPEARRRRRCLLEAVGSWVEHLPRCRFLLTARPYAYADPAWQLPEFTILSLAEFNSRQVKNFIEQWYQAVRTSQGWDDTTAGQRAAELLQALEIRSDLADLASRPLLLTLMATLHSHKSRMPENRADLYEFSVGLLLQRWQEARLIPNDQGGWDTEPGIQQVLGLGESRLRTALEALALQTHIRQGQSASGREEAAEKIPADIPIGDVLEVFSALAPHDLNPRELVRYFEERAGLLVGREEGVYTFAHRSFQEYLAACRLANTESDYAQKLGELVTQDLDWWREVFLLGVGKKGQGGLGGAVDILNRLVPQDPREMDRIEQAQWRLAVLAGESARDLRLRENVSGNNYFQTVLERLRGWLTALVNGGYLPLRERYQAGDVLGALGDQRQGVSLRFDQGDGPQLPDIAWALVPAGEFLMGSLEQDEQAWKDERPQHTLSLDRYWISRYPLTNAQFAPFVAQGYDQERFWTPQGWEWRNGAEPDLSALDSITDEDFKKNYREWVLSRKTRIKPNWWQDPKWGAPNRPVVGITWFEAAAYCRWLDEALRSAGLLPEDAPDKYRVRLPSEAEWEKAARGTDARTWQWGDEWQEGRANTEEAGLNETSPVGIFPSADQPYGLFDMTGNVWEWTLSKWGMSAYEPDYGYPYEPGDGRQLPGGADFRVVRGGSWNHSRWNARCASRNWFIPTLFYGNIGFRVVLSLVLPGF